LFADEAKALCHFKMETEIRIVFICFFAVKGTFKNMNLAYLFVYHKRPMF